MDLYSSFHLLTAPQCFTFGVTLGAIVYGALLPAIGWVRPPPSPHHHPKLTPLQRAIFYIQTPLGVLGGLTVYLSIPPSTAHQTPKDQSKTTPQKLLEVDYLGALTLSLTTTTLLLSLSTPSLLPLLFLLLPLFLLLQSTHPTPILPLPTLLHTPTLLSCLSQLLFMASRWTLLFYGPVFALAVRGLSPAAAGSVLLPTNIGFALGGVGAGVVMHRRPRASGVYWGECIACLTWFGASFAGLSWASGRGEMGWFLAGAFMNGVGTGAALNYTLGHVLGRAGEGEGFLVTGLLSTFRGFAGSFGAAGGGGLFGRLLRRGLEKGGFEGGMVNVLVGSPAKVWEEGVLSEAERGVAVRAYSEALSELFAVVVGVVVVVVVLQAGTGWKGREEEEEDG